VYENGKMRPVETVQGKKKDGGSEFNYDTL
jgi:hypothetical protein